MSLNSLRNKLKRLETEKVNAANSDISTDFTDTCGSDVTADRTAWVSKIQRNGNKPGDWLEMIKSFENSHFNNTDTVTRHLYISNIYADALKCVPDGEKKTLQYAQLLIQCANFRGQKSVDDAREIFQDARLDAKKFAIVHIAAAQFELNQGNKDKAKKILDKARSQNAEPASMISAAYKNIIFDCKELLNEFIDVGQTCPNSESNKENIEDSNCNPLPSKLSGFKPPLHPNLSFRKRPITATELKPTLSHVKPEEGTNIAPVSTNRQERRNSDHVSDDPNTLPLSISSHVQSGGTNSGGHNIAADHDNQVDSLDRPRTLRTYHSTPDCKKSSILSLPGGSSVKGVFQRKKLNIGKPMRIPRASPLTEELNMADTNPSRLPESSSEPVPIPSAMKSLSLQHECPSAAPPTRSKLMEGARRQSESDDDSIRLKPLPEFSPEERYQRHNPSVFDVRSGRGSMDSDSGIVSNPGNLSSQLPLAYGMSPPHLSEQPLQPIFSAVADKSEHHAPALTTLEPKPSTTKSFLDASQLSTKTLINSSLVDAASKTLTNRNESKLDVDMKTSDAKTLNDINQGSGSDSGISSESVSTECGNKSGIQENPAISVNNGVKPSVDDNKMDVDKVVNPSSNNVSSINPVNNVQPPEQVHSNQAHADNPRLNPHVHGMQTPHHKQQVQMSMYTPVQAGVPYLQAQPMHTPMQAGAAMYPVVNGGVQQPQQPYPAQHYPQQMMTPLQNQQKMLWIKGKCYTVIRVIGKGGYSKVYEVLDSEYSMLAVKCVNMDNADEMTIESYKNEIELLQRLQYSRLIIKMYDYEYNEKDNMLYVVMEKGERDLATFFRSRIKRGDMSLKLLFFYWEEMLKAVLVLHKEGIVHSDLKPSNFIIVAGDLKLIDFGIAKAIQSDMTSVTREQQVGTLNYMSPEAIMDTCGGTQLDEQGRVKPRIKIGVKSDVWSLGCILYYLVYRKTPFQHITNSWMKLQAITNPDLPIEFPVPEHFGPLEHTQLVYIMKRCLTRDPKDRMSIEELLETPLWAQSSCKTT